jgi:hypothetical protein
VGSFDESRLENEAATSEIVEDILVKIRDSGWITEALEVVRCGLVSSSLSLHLKDYNTADLIQQI